MPKHLPHPMTAPMLEIQDLEIARGNRKLIGDLSFTLTPGTLLLVTGSNGSGKTSLLRALCGLLAPIAGEIRWHGENIRSLREDYWKNLLYIGHNNGLKGDLTAGENLAALCALGGVETSAAQRQSALAQFGLADRSHSATKSLSQGQRRRTALARLALCTALPLWVLDEPFAALDSAAITDLQGTVSQHLGNGGAVVMTTHQDVRIAAPTVTRLNLDQRTH